MAYSRQYRSVRFNQAFNEANTADNRTFIPAPRGGENTGIAEHALPLQFSPDCNFMPTDQGLIVPKDGKGRAVQAGLGLQWRTLMTFVGSASADSRIFAHTGTEIYNITPYINSASASVSAGNLVSVCASLGANIGPFGWTEFNKSLILVNDAATASALRYTTALGKFIPWSATASGDSIHNMYGVSSFKSRIYAWPKSEPKFFYGSTDSILGTLEPFSLGHVAPRSQHIMTFFGMTRDGGSGPDDFATFIMNDGAVVVYQGSDPGDANNWALVGTYQIGKPMGRRCAVAAKSQHYVMCEDDIWVLPRDLQGKNQPTNFVKERRAPSGFEPAEIDGVYNNVTGQLIYEDGTVIALNQPGEPGFTFLQGLVNPIVHVGRTFFADTNTPDDDAVLLEFNPTESGSTNYGSPALKTAPIPINSRANISLYNPIFKQSDGNKIVFKSRVLYDFSASADWVTATASGDTTGVWMPGFGTGSRPQIEVAIVSASAGTRVAGLISPEVKFIGSVR